METEHSIHDQISEGKLLFEDGKYIEAIEIFSHILGEMEDEFVRVFLARCFFRLEKYELASKHFKVLLSSTRYHDYATSMLATVNLIWGNYNEALRQIQKLPPNPNNLITHLYILYYIHRHTKQEWAIYDAEKLMRKISLCDLSDENKFKFHLACGMVKQACKEYSQAMSHYENALTFSPSESKQVKVLDELGSMYTENGELDKAERILLQVNEFFADKSEMEKGINFKLLGLLERKKRDYKKARQFFQEALKILNEKETYFEAAEVNCLLMELNKSDFYMSAECYSTVLQCEQAIKEVKKENEKVIDILDNNISSTGSSTTTESPTLTRFPAINPT
jgi:tetratricopeptide (TPR) repeat protein